MASKKEIFKKVRILITQQFDSPEEAFRFFDKNEDGYLEKKELKKLIRKAKVNRFITGIVAKKMIEGLDKNKDKKFNWQEFKLAVDRLIEEGLNKKS